MIRSVARPRSDAAGFSLVEVLVASLILALALLALSGLFALGLKNNAISKEDTVMAALAQDKLEQLKRLNGGVVEGLFGVCGCTTQNAACGADCYPTANCPANSPSRIWSQIENPVADPNPQDDVRERLYVRETRIEKVSLGQPVGCVTKMTVTVGSRNGLLAPRPTTAPSWSGAAPGEVVGNGNPRRVILSIYRP